MKIKVKVSTDKIGSETSKIIEIDDEDLEELEGYAREEFLNRETEDAAFDLISYDWEEVE